MNIIKIFTDVCFKYLRTRKYSIVAISSAIAVYVYLKRKGVNKCSEKLTYSESRQRKSDMDKFIRETEDVINMIWDASLVSDLNVSCLNSTHDGTFNDKTFEFLDVTEDFVEKTSELSRNPALYRDFWRLTDATDISLNDLSCHQLPHPDLSNCDLQADLNLSNCEELTEVTDLEWESPGRGQWYGVASKDTWTRTRHRSYPCSDYGSLGDSDIEDNPVGSCHQDL